jgi:hypothetical protein
MRIAHLSDTDIARFWSKVDRSGGPDACWPWQAAINNKGYGRFRFPDREVLAHRLAWAIVNGEIPGGLNALHSCDNSRCCNPGHIFLGTQLDNILDMHAKGRALRSTGDQHGTKTHPERIARGEQSPFAKLTNDAVVEIFTTTDRSRGYQTRLARKFGVASQQISNIMLGKTWTHVTNQLRGPS